MEEIQLEDEQRKKNADSAWWNLLGVLWRWKRFIIVLTGITAIASVVVSLILPNWFKATSRLLLPESSSGGLSSALLGDVSSALSLIGGGGGDYVRYLAILNSRTVVGSAVDSFDLVRVYELEDEDFPFEDAIAVLRDNVEFVIDDELEYLSIETLDQDPIRAADISNYFVRALNRVDNELASKTAGQFRQFVEQRFHESTATRIVLLDSLQAFQENYGVFDLEAQTVAYFEQLAEMRISVFSSEIRYMSLKSLFGDENPTVQSTAEVLSAAQQLYDAALAGKEQVFPVSQEDAPGMIHRYAELMMEKTIQEKIIELVAPMLEKARFDEQRQVEAVQIVDSAVPPSEKFKPKRSIIVVASTLSGFILAVLYAFLVNWWKTNHVYLARRLDEAATVSAQAKV